MRTMLLRLVRPGLLLALVTLMVQAMFALPARAAVFVISVAIPSFNSTNIQGWQLNGDATQVSDVIRLAPATTDQSGSAFWRNRISLDDNRSFSSYFVVSFPNPGGQAPGGADGIVFTLQTVANTAGSGGGGIGYQGIAPSVGVEFDTWQNNENSDPNDNHVGLNVGGSVSSVETNTNLPGTLQGGTWHVWIEYNGPADELQVRMNSLNSRAGAALVLDVTRDLVADIGPDVFVGFTAGTGQAFEDHDLEAFYFANEFIPGGINTPPDTFNQAPATVNAVANPASIATGGSSTITATVLDVNDAPLANQTVTFSTTLGTLSAPTALTNASGQASVILNGGASAGTATVRASAVGGVYGEATVAVTGASLAAPTILTPAAGEVTWRRPTFTGTAVPNVTVIATIDIDNDPATTNTVTYEVRSTAQGTWTLNLVSATPIGGVFPTNGLDLREDILITVQARNDSGLLSPTNSQVYDVAYNWNYPWMEV